MVNAGHDPAFRIRQGAIKAFERTAPPVGLAPAADYDRQAGELELSLEPGDLLFTYTDGVTEAMNASHEEFSLPRVKAALLQGGGAKEALDRILAGVKAHAAGAEQSDDITMLALKAGTQ
jgi:sigma-B regulation protein RsbU (phosphoserine phosphatase)